MEALRDQGLDLVPGTRRETFHVTLDVRGNYDAEFDPPEVAEALAGLPARLAAAPGSRALLTEESLAASDREQIGRLLAACAGREVHLIVTVRDLARQIPSAWQQSLQRGSAKEFDAYLQRLTRTEGKGRGPWRSKDIPEILGRWAEFVPAERIHVVTVPPSGSDPEELLREVLQRPRGRRRAGWTERSRAATSPCGHIDVEVLRRVNEKLPSEFIRRDVYGDVGKRFFAGRILGQDGGRRSRCRAAWRSGAARCPPDTSSSSPRRASTSWATSPTWCRPHSSFSDDGATATEAEVADAATDAIALMLTGQMEKLRQSRRKAAGPVPTPEGCARWFAVGSAD